MGFILATCRDRAYLEAHYLPPLREAGWAGPFRVAAAEAPPEAPEDLLAGAAALLLSGGGDIHPGAWDPAEPVHPTAEVDADRDRLELPLVRAAWARGLPLLGICRGAQILNVALGGSLVQDIPSACGCPEDRHRHGSAEAPGELHPVELAPASRLAALLGPGPVPVNSRHHQAVARVAPGLRACGWDPSTHSAEGPLVEAVEAVDPGHWAFGVQWHPENLARRGDPAGAASRALFAAFLRAAAEGPRRPL